MKSFASLKVAHGDLDPNGPTLAISLFEPFFTNSWEDLRPNWGRNGKYFAAFLVNIVMAPVTLAKANNR